MIAISKPTPIRLVSTVCSKPSRRSSHRLVVHAKDNKSRQTGIHDPAGPTGSWGSGIKHSKQEGKSKEEKFRMDRDELLREEKRSDAAHHHANRPENNEATTQPATDKADDDEYAHMSKAEKATMLLKDKLFSWLGTGYEPL